LRLDRRLRDGLRGQSGFQTEFCLEVARGAFELRYYLSHLACDFRYLLGAEQQERQKEKQHHFAEVHVRRSPLFAGFFFAFLQRRLQAADTLAQAFAELTDLARAKHEQGDEGQYKHFRHSQFPDHFNLLLGG
jgi:hypothetical protein